MSRETQEETRELNVAFFEQLRSGDRNQEKKAIDAVNDFTRTKMREQGFARRILPPIPVGPSDLTRRMETDKPVMIVDKEPDSPAAITVGFGTLPDGYWIKGDRYMVGFGRLFTPRFQKDTSELMTWVMDIRQVLSDNALKDLLAEEDSKFIGMMNTAMISQGTTVPTSGVAQWQRFPGGIARDSLFDSKKIIKNTPYNLVPHTALTNHVTIEDVCKFGRNEQGGDTAEEIMLNGWTLQKYMGLNWVITIKKSLVPNSTIYQFADPAFMGKFYELVPTTMYIETKAFLLDFFCYEEIGMTLAHSASVSRVDYV